MEKIIDIIPYLECFLATNQEEMEILELLNKDLNKIYIKIGNILKEEESIDKNKKELINFLELEISNINSLDIYNNSNIELRFNLFKSIAKTLKSNKSIRLKCLYEIIAIYQKVLIIYKYSTQDLKIIELIIQKNQKIEYLEWFNFFKKDIVQQFLEVMFLANFEKTYSCDNILRMLRVIEENIMFFLLIMESPRKMWDPQLVISFYDYQRNLSRFETHSQNNIPLKENKVIYNNVSMNKNDYLKQLQTEINEFEKNYIKTMSSYKLDSEKKLKKELKLTNKDIIELKKILNIKDKQKKKEEINNFFYKKKKIKKPHGIKRNDYIENQMKKISFLNYKTSIPNNINKHIENNLINNGIFYDGQVTKISEFHKYMETYSVTGILTKSKSPKELNMSSHLMLDGASFDEEYIICNKIDTIKNFIDELYNNFPQYINLIIKTYFPVDNIEKIINQIKLENKLKKKG